MRGIRDWFFARGRAPATAAPRPSASELTRLSGDEGPHGTVSCDQLEESFYRFILNLPVDAGEQAQPALEQMLLQRLKDTCDSGRFDVRSLPRMPSVLPQLMRAMKSDTVNGAQLADLIRRDPVLVGEVMRVTGSVTYRTAHPIGSLQHAVVLLGQIGLRHVVTSYVMKPILMASAGNSGQVVGQRLWDHAERSAHAAVFLSKGQCDPFEAYLAGLVGFTGLGAIARLMDRGLGQDQPACSSLFIAGCARLAAQLTVQASRHWDLPPPVLDALVEQAESTADAMTLPMSRVLHVAQRLAMRQLLAEQGLLDGDTDYAGEAFSPFPAPLLARCRQDLRKNFAEP
ncbi:HDOD domain-containing protein [Dyella solisilvae]|uniref:HDOD domain-containing protein n=1 Tax=Dyella solisilvae TaxID=1920168 RepID=A0A370KB45_9GAMM|nr:HDOD domain-containing protein [Dyella solisilvae]RDI99876.1 HDOD domain-containing protein [Dyella solisilvae]